MPHSTVTVLSLRRVYVLITSALVAFAALVRPIPPNDFWFHLATGRLILDSGAIPTVDTFSHTQAGAAFFNQSWLAQVVLYGLHRAGGIPMVLIAHAALLVLAYGLFLWLCLRRSARTRLSVLLVLGVVLPASVMNWTVRPQSLALPLFAVFFVLLERYRLDCGDEQHDTRAWLWPLPLLMVVWVNVHGSFVLGGVLLGLVLVAEATKRGTLRYPALTWRAWRRLLGWSVVTAMAMLANPRGIEVVGYVTNLLTTPAVRDLITEWAPPTIGSLTGAPFFAAAIVVFVVAMYARQPPDLTDLLVILAFFALGLSGTRNAVWFAMVAAPFAAAQGRTLFHNREDRDPGSPAMNVAISAGVLALVLAVLPWTKPHLLPDPAGRLLTEDTPVAAVETLRADPSPPARLVNGLAAGSYLTWALPGQPVFIDPRIELYPLAQIQDYFTLSQGRDVNRLLDRYDVDGALLSWSEEAPLIEILKDDPEWATVYEDDHYAYLKRRP